MRSYIDFSDLTDAEREEFVDGFKDADDIGVNDWETSAPWGAPWEWSDGMSVPRGVVSAYEMGREWFRQNRADILEVKSRDRDELAADAD